MLLPSSVVWGSPEQRLEAFEGALSAVHTREYCHGACNKGRSCRRSARVIVTASGGMRGSKRVELKEIVDAAAKAAADKGHKVRPLLLRPCVCWENTYQNASCKYGYAYMARY